MVEGEKDNAVWTEIGALWKHAQGDGFNLNLKALPFAKDARLAYPKDIIQGGPIQWGWIRK